MPQLAGDLLIHPVRLRIVTALVERPMTAAELGDVLGDVPQATLYRQLSTLEEGGIIEVVDRRRARGAAERTFAVVDGAASLGADDVADATPEDHMRWFTVFVGTLLADVAAYLEGGGTDLAGDRVGYRQVPLWLTDAEFDELAAELRAALGRRATNGPAPGRRRRLLTTIVVPDDRATPPTWT